MSSSHWPIPFAGCFTTDRTRDTRCVFIGIPDDSQSSFRRGSSEGPTAMRIAYDGRSFNSTTESGVDLSEAVADFGDLSPENSGEASSRKYRRLIEKLLRHGKIPFIAGGDHAVTIPVVEAFAVLKTPLHVVQIDAHPGVYSEFEGNPFSHACVAARLLEMDHVASVTQLGIRTLNSEQAAQLERFPDRLRIFYANELMGELPSLSHLDPGSAVYLTIDLDGFDPAFAPGVSHPVPGGLSSRQVMSFIQRAEWNLVGMDVVELNPSQDVNYLTAILAARLLHEGMGYVMGRKKL